MAKHIVVDVSKVTWMCILLSSPLTRNLDGPRATQDCTSPKSCEARHVTTELVYLRYTRHKASSLTRMSLNPRLRCTGRLLWGISKAALARSRITYHPGFGRVAKLGARTSRPRRFRQEITALCNGSTSIRRGQAVYSASCNTETG